MLLRPWRSSDAAALHPILSANHARLGPWIPARIADPAPLPLLTARLAAFAADFAADREWRYAMCSRSDGELLGEFSLFPRAPGGRVPYADADRIEFGYWLRAEATGQGYVTEAARALLDVVWPIPQFRRVEIHCDERNVPSGAVPERLGFTLTPDGSNGGAGEVRIQVWTLACDGTRGDMDVRG